MVTLFTTGCGVSTLPLQIYSMIKIAVMSEVNATSTLPMLVRLGMILLAASSTGRRAGAGGEGVARLVVDANVCVGACWRC